MMNYNQENLKHLAKIKKDVIEDCDDCGLTSVLNRTVCHTLMDKPVTHWRSQCRYCKRYQHPITLEWLEVRAQDLTQELSSIKNREKLSKKTTF